MLFGFISVAIYVHQIAPFLICRSAKPRHVNARFTFSHCRAPSISWKDCPDWAAVYKAGNYSCCKQMEFNGTWREKKKKSTEHLQLHWEFWPIPWGASPALQAAPASHIATHLPSHRPCNVASAPAAPTATTLEADPWRHSTYKSCHVWVTYGGCVSKMIKQGQY